MIKCLDGYVAAYGSSAPTSLCANVELQPPSGTCEAAGEIWALRAGVTRFFCARGLQLHNLDDSCKKGRSWKVDVMVWEVRRTGFCGCLPIAADASAPPGQFLLY
jgi:hypothetical protein